MNIYHECSYHERSGVKSVLVATVQRYKGEGDAPTIHRIRILHEELLPTGGGRILKDEIQHQEDWVESRAIRACIDRYDDAKKSLVAAGWTLEA